MNRQTKSILRLLTFFIAMFLVFSGVIYYSVSNYSQKYFFNLLEIRAQTIARIEIDHDASLEDTVKEMSLTERLPYEEDYIIILRPETNLKEEAVHIDVKFHFLEEIVASGNAKYTDKESYSNGLLHTTPNGKFIIITKAENYFEKYQSKNLRHTLLFSVLTAILFSIYIIYYFSRNIFRPISDITEKVKGIGSENLHLRLDEKSRNNELNELAKTFNNMLDRIETSFETQNNFISNASHELRTPLTSIIGEADVTLSKPRSQEDYIESIKVILEEAEKLDKKTEALLFLAQTGFNGKVQKFEKVRIDQLIWDIKENLEKLDSRNKIRIDTGLLPENPMKLKINGNAQLLHLAFSNIISNGCKYSNYNQVSVSISASDNFVFVIIKDNGIGIPQEDIEHIYDPFFRASNVKNYEGYGIGLPLSKNIIRMHQGKIEVHSIENEGTLVKISLPMWKQE